MSACFCAKGEAATAVVSRKYSTSIFRTTGTSSISISTTLCYVLFPSKSKGHRQVALTPGRCIFEIWDFLVRNYHRSNMAIGRVLPIWYTTDCPPQTALLLASRHVDKSNRQGSCCCMQWISGEYTHPVRPCCTRSPVLFRLSSQDVQFRSRLSLLKMLVR